MSLVFIEGENVSDWCLTDLMLSATFLPVCPGLSFRTAKLFLLLSLVSGSKKDENLGRDKSYDESVQYIEQQIAYLHQNEKQTQNEANEANQMTLTMTPTTNDSLTSSSSTSHQSELCTPQMNQSSSMNQNSITPSSLLMTSLTSPSSSLMNASNTNTLENSINPNGPNPFDNDNIEHLTQHSRLSLLFLSDHPILRSLFKAAAHMHNQSVILNELPRTIQELALPLPFNSLVAIQHPTALNQNNNKYIEQLFKVLDRRAPQCKN